MVVPLVLLALRKASHITVTIILIMVCLRKGGALFYSVLLYHLVGSYFYGGYVNRFFV